jgi:hypothetical protein
VETRDQLHGPVMAQQPLFDQGLLTVEASRSHSDTPHSVGLFWTSDQSVAETSTSQHTTLQETGIHTTGGIQTRIPSMRTSQTHALNRATTGIGAPATLLRGNLFGTHSVMGCVDPRACLAGLEEGTISCCCRKSRYISPIFRRLTPLSCTGYGIGSFENNLDGLLSSECVLLYSEPITYLMQTFIFAVNLECTFGCFICVLAVTV